MVDGTTIINNAKDAKTHYYTIPCGRFSMYGMNKTIILDEITCKSCRRHLGLVKKDEKK